MASHLVGDPIGSPISRVAGSNHKIPGQWLPSLKNAQSDRNRIHGKKAWYILLAKWNNVSPTWIFSEIRGPISFTKKPPFVDFGRLFGRYNLTSNKWYPWMVDVNLFIYGKLVGIRYAQNYMEHLEMIRFATTKNPSIAAIAWFVFGTEVPYIPCETHWTVSTVVEAFQQYP